MLRYLSGDSFGISGAYDLIESGKISQPRSEDLAGYTFGEGIYGVFRSNAADSPVRYKIAYKDVALLYYHLQQSHELPQYMLAAYNDEINQALAQLVLGGVLTIAVGDHNYTGAAAASFISPSATASIPTESAISILSKNALYDVYRLHQSQSALAARLYTYHTTPVQKGKWSFLESNHAVDGHLYPAAMLVTIRINWRSQEQQEKQWQVWHKKDTPSFNTGQYPTFKLYISPTYIDLPKVLELSIPLLGQSACFCFKTGASPNGILRPDKFIAYFLSIQDLKHAVALLQPALIEFPAQGVPFTSQLDDKGLLSWGIDPPGNEAAFSTERSSWRSQLVNSLAHTMVQAKQEKLDKAELLPFVTSNLEAQGIDIQTWSDNNYVSI